MNKSINKDSFDNYGKAYPLAGTAGQTCEHESVKFSRFVISAQPEQGT